MKNIFGIALCLMMVLSFSCSKDSISSSKVQENILGTWIVVSYDNHITGESIVKTVDNTTTSVSGDLMDVVISFVEDSLSNEFQGRVVSRGMHGEYSYVEENKISFDVFVLEETGHPDWGDYFVDAIGLGQYRYELNDTILRVYYDGDTKSVVFSRVE